MMGDVVFKRSPTGETIMSKVPDMSKGEWGRAQKEYRKRFKQAIAYARAAMAEPRARAIYEKKAAKARRSPWNMARSDYFKGKDLLAKK